MDRTKQVYLFGDQTTNFSTKLTSLIRSSNGPILTYFFDEAFQVLRKATTRLSNALSDRFPRCSRLEELIEQHEDGALHPAFQQALTSIYHFACFISHCEHNNGQYPDADNALLVGLCTGSFATAAIGCCSSLSELMPVALYAVNISFLTGLNAATEGEAIVGGQPLTSSSWSLVVPGMNERTASQLVEEFSRNAKFLVTSRPWISAVSENNVTLSGPPEVLDILQHISALSNARIIRMPIFAPYHAGHLFDDTMVERILEQADYMLPGQHKPIVPVLSSSSGALLWDGSLRSMMRSAVVGVLIQPLRWDMITRGVVSHIKTTDVTAVNILSIGTVADQPLAVALGNNSGGFSGGLSIRVADIGSVPQLENDDPQQPSRETSKIAIVGMSGRFPEAEDCDEYWKLLSLGLDVHKPAPDFHWSVKTHVDTTGSTKNTSATPYGCWLKNPGAFDARFFNMSPREAPQVDPAQRLALATAYEAMESAGMVPDATPSTKRDRVGIFYGVTSNDWMETNSAQDIGDTYFIPGGNRAFIPGRVNYYFKFSGPSYSVDTACSSSLAAIHLACNALWRKEVDTALAGGTSKSIEHLSIHFNFVFEHVELNSEFPNLDILTNPDFTAGLDRGHFLSRTGNCKTFDDEADGYCRGEGVVTLVLKRLEDAIADNDPIQAVILGARTNHSAEAESITRPHVGAQKAIFSNILRDAGVDPGEISYVEMHGTGTQAGDAGEMNSVLDTFAPANGRSRRRANEPLHIGSAKSNIGHGEAASGASALAKVLLMMKHNMIPPHCGIKTKLNRKFPTDLKQRQIHIADKLTAWDRGSGVRKVFVNNFSAAGGNSALLLEDAPRPVPRQSEARSVFPLCISAKTAGALERNIQNLIQYIDVTDGIDQLLPSLSYTTTARRMHHPHRVAISASDIAGLKEGLRKSIANKDGATRNKSVPKVVFTFTGQGSQYAGMGKVLMGTNTSFRETLSHLDHLAQRHGYQSFLPVFANDVEPIDNYSPTTVQLATVALEIALARLWMSWGIQPTAVLGHSLGEYAALCISGVLSLSDTLYLVGKRARLLEAHCTKWTHSMLAVKSSLQRIESVLRQGRLEVACVNGPEDIVLAGRSQDILRAQQQLTETNTKSTLLKVPFAFHSAQVEPILEEFTNAVHVKFHNPTIPILCPLHGSMEREAEVFSPAYLRDHCRQTVNVVKAIEAARDAGVVDDKSFVLEIGPHPVVCGMFKAVLGQQLTILSSLQRSKDPWSTVTASITAFYRAGFAVNWQEYQRDYSHQVLQLPAYSWDLKNYWIQYVNDWSLRKGDPVQPLQEVMHSTKGLPADKKAEPPMRLESTTIHKVIVDELKDGRGELVIESDICRPDLHPMVQGHKVDGFPLCTPSVYADIALTVGDYLLQKQKSIDEMKVDVAAMSITKALIAKSKGTQILKTTVNLKWAERIAHCKFATVDDAGKVVGEHANCEIRFTETDKLDIQHVDVPAVKARIAALQEGMHTGNSFRFNKAMIYKMVTALADFDPNYRGLETIVLDSEAMEACSTVNFAGIKADGEFHTHPAFIDALSQVGGFVMNANDKSDLDKEVFVNHGWGSFQILEPISASKRYSTYVKMQETEGKMWRGNIVVFDGEKVVAWFGDIAVQGVPRRLLRYILAADGGSPKANVEAKAPKVIKPSPQTSAAKLTGPAIQGQTAKITSTPAQIEKSLIKVAPTEQITPLATCSSNSKPKINGERDRKRIQHVLQIISEESGIVVAELNDSSEFTDLGVDSLLSMLIISRLNDEMAIELDTSAFIDLPTILDLKSFLFRDSLDDASEQELVADVTENPQTPDPVPVGSAVLAPDNAAHAMHVNKKLQAKEPELNHTFEQVLDILSEESGIARTELTEDSNFADMGVDSLLSLMIVSRVQEELNIGHDWDTSLWSDCDTIGALRQRLVGREEDIDSDGSSDEKSRSSQNGFESSISTPPYERDGVVDCKLTPMVDSDDERISEYIEVRPPLVNAPPASSVVLQGRVRFARRVLFLFPDGSGSAHSYAQLPAVNDDLAIVGLNCPFRRDASSMENCPLDSLIDSYITEIRKRQPNGPYHLGGWSAGGILAYRAAQKLICETEEVKTLVLIDSPPPIGLDRLPQHFYDHCSAIGLFGAKMPDSGQLPTAPEWLIPHFNATITVLSNYWADPLPEGLTPRASIMWAADSVFDGVKFPRLPPHPDDTEGMKFLTEKRRDLSAGDWSDLFPGDDVEVEVATGADHFSLMSEKADILARFIDRATY